LAQRQRQYYVKTPITQSKKIKPWVQFGISPFGVWRNKSVDQEVQIHRQDRPIVDLFADPIAWMEDNYIDYILPQYTGA
jgi:uncharacterized lipoprotein YddW (UPF0748 family)